MIEKDLSHPSRVRGLKHWSLCPQGISYPSHPSRVRGLKQKDGQLVIDSAGVAPLAGAWIETAQFKARRLKEEGRTPRGCVD